MKSANIYTIGYGLRTLEDFIKILKDFGIEYLIDVRSKPISKFNPKFNQADLQFHLSQNGIKYVFMGDNLGGRPDDNTCYNSEGKVDYKKVEAKEFYKEGILRLKKACENGLNIALMCSEAKPSQCHRSKLIGMTLHAELEYRNCIKHIDEYGKIKDQATVINEVNKGKSPIDLFNNQSYATSNKSYTQ